MTSWNPLKDAEHGTLYDMDCHFMSTVRYCIDSPETVRLIFDEKPAGLPKRLFLMPDGKQYDYRAFIYTLTDEPEACPLPDGAGAQDTAEQAGSVQGTDEAPAAETGQNEPVCQKEVYIVRGVTDDIQEVRKNFRVYVSFHTSVYFDGSPKETSVTIKDIGCGGFLFVSDQKYSPGDTLSVILFDARNPLLVRARIRKLRPVRREGRYGYGCEYIDLNSQAEARIRNYVFRTEVLQVKTRES